MSVGITYSLKNSIIVVKNPSAYYPSIVGYIFAPLMCVQCLFLIFPSPMKAEWQSSCHIIHSCGMLPPCMCGGRLLLYISCWSTIHLPVSVVELASLHLSLYSNIHNWIITLRNENCAQLQNISNHWEQMLSGISNYLVWNTWQHLLLVIWNNFIFKISIY